MSEEEKVVTHEDIWDDSALVNSWNEALEEYKVSRIAAVLLLASISCALSRMTCLPVAEKKKKKEKRSWLAMLPYLFSSFALIGVLGAVRVAFCSSFVFLFLISSLLRAHVTAWLNSTARGKDLRKRLKQALTTITEIPQHSRRQGSRGHYCSRFAKVRPLSTIFCRLHLPWSVCVL